MDLEEAADGMARVISTWIAQEQNRPDLGPPDYIVGICKRYLESRVGLSGLLSLVSSYNRLTGAEVKPLEETRIYTQFADYLRGQKELYKRK